MNTTRTITPPSPQPQPQQPPPPLSELILSMEQATSMAKQLPTITDPNHLLQIYAYLHQTHHHLSTFLSNFPPPPQQQRPRPRPPLPIYAAAENSLSSSATEPMQVGEEEEEGDFDDDHEENSKSSIDKLEEKMRDFGFVKNKRLKRQLSPSFATEERRFCEDGYGRVKGFDPYENRLRALELIYQFHG